LGSEGGALRSIRRIPARAAGPADSPAPPAPAGWAEEREQLLELLAQQQRVAQAGLVTSAMAHDINNHLQRLTGAACLALMSERPDDWRQALQQVQELSREIADTSHTFLSFVRRQDAVAEGSFLASDAVEQAARLVAPLAEKHGVALTCHVAEDAAVSGESRLLVQALVNLASNAIRACAPSKGKLTIEASCPAGRFVRFEVQDDGPGIPEAMRGRLFRPFSTGNASSGGNGLGLFIVRQTIRRLGGTIRVRTSSASGTTFVVDVPRAG
jgi:signal transduction histidine kinase